MSFENAVAVILDMEGGFVDNPDDAGGPTNLGITQRLYDRWRAAGGLPQRSVRYVTKDEATTIYHDWFWMEVCGDSLPWEAAFLAFDSAVQHSPDTGAKLLQRAARVTMDGIVGPVTIAAVWADPVGVARRMFFIRLRRYLDRARNMPSQRQFLRGWIERLWRVGTLAEIPETEL